MNSKKSSKTPPHFEIRESTECPNCKKRDTVRVEIKESSTTHICTHCKKVFSVPLIRPKVIKSKKKK